MIYPTMGASWFFLDCVQDKVTDLEVNLVTIGLPGGSGTSVTKKSQNDVFFVTLELTTMLKYRLTAAHYKLRSCSEVSPIYLGKLNQPILNFIC